MKLKNGLPYYNHIEYMFQAHYCSQEYLAKQWSSVGPLTIHGRRRHRRVFESIQKKLRHKSQRKREKKIEKEEIERGKRKRKEKEERERGKRKRREKEERERGE